jgi:hypothetical protein
MAERDGIPHHDETGGEPETLANGGQGQSLYPAAESRHHRNQRRIALAGDASGHHLHECFLKEIAQLLRGHELAAVAAHPQAAMAGSEV